MVEAFTVETFLPYLFGNFACIMMDVTGDHTEFWTQDHPSKFLGKDSTRMLLRPFPSPHR